MHFTLLTLPVALLAAVASGHTINCWGKALNPPVESVDYITDLMDKVATGKSDTIPGYSDRKSLYLDGKSCKELACFKGAQVRWCNTAGGGKTLQMQNIVDAVKVLRRDCRAVVPPHDTAGGVLYQTDNWNVILQQEDACEGKK